MKVGFAYGVIGVVAVCWGCSKGSLQDDDGGVAPDGRSFDVPIDLPIDLRGSTDADRPDIRTLDIIVLNDLTGPNDLTVGPDTPPDGSTARTGWQSFVIQATSTAQQDGGMAVPSPISNTFTMAIDWDTRTAIVGSTGGGSVLPFQPTVTGLFIAGPFSLGVSAGGGTATLSYQMLDLTIAVGGWAITGTGNGQEFYILPNSDAALSAPTTIRLSGVPDAEPPRLTGPTTQIDVFTSVTYIATEPLPPGSKAVLADLRGERVTLAPPGLEAVFSFPTLAKMWRYNDQYTVLLDGIIDFGGNLARPQDAISFTTGDPPPLIVEDGFESATGTTVGGAQVLSGSGAPTITGVRSLYIPPVNGTLPTGSAETTQITLRLALSSGDTMVRFSYRTVNPTTLVGGSYFMMASEGGWITSLTLPSDSTQPTAATINGSAVMLGPVTTASFPLPSDAAREIVLTRRVRGSGNLPPRPEAGLIIDDLRAE